jgi:hypothetical protein
LAGVADIASPRVEQQLPRAREAHQGIYAMEFRFISALLDGADLHSLRLFC